MSSPAPTNWWEMPQPQLHAEAVNWWEASGTPPSTEREERKELEYPVGAENPYTEYSKTVADDLATRSFDGKATIPTHQWHNWNENRRYYGAGGQTLPEPNRYQEVSFTDIARRGYGWKLHLNFDATDSGKVQRVGTFLTALSEQGVINLFKIGNGGGKAAGAPGKEATAYVGHRDKANVVAPVIEAVLGSVLDPPEGDALVDDIAFTRHVAGRFHINGVDPSFHQYGAKGHPKLNEDVGKLLMPIFRNLDAETQSQLNRAMQERADAVLRQRFGTFYTGTGL